MAQQDETAGLVIQRGNSGDMSVDMVAKSTLGTCAVMPSSELKTEAPFIA